MKGMSRRGCHCSHISRHWFYAEDTPREICIVSIQEMCVFVALANRMLRIPWASWAQVVER